MPPLRRVYWTSFALLIALLVTLTCCNNNARTYPQNYILLGLFTMVEGVVLGVICRQVPRCSLAFSLRDSIYSGSATDSGIFLSTRHLSEHAPRKRIDSRRNCNAFFLLKLSALSFRFSFSRTE